MLTIEKLEENLEAFEHDETLIQDYKDSYESLIRSGDPETLENLMKKHPEHFLCIAPLVIGSWFMHHRFQDIYNLLKEVELLGSDRHMDYFNSKLIKYYYQSLKFLEKPIDQLYTILATNKEYGNKYSIAVTTNAILDCQINNHIYTVVEEDMVDVEERCRYCLYLGVIELVRGEYKTALRHFDESDILNTSKKIEMLLKKYTIVCKLLLSDYAVFYPYSEELRPYFSLIGCVKRGDVSQFYRLLEEHRKEYFGMNLYFVIRRLLQVLVQEGLRKITVCYSRIRVSDISDILGTKVEYLIRKTMKEGHVQGRIEDEIFYGQNGELKRTYCGGPVRRAVEVRKMIEKNMRYPEVVPLSYEKVFEGEVK